MSTSRRRTGSCHRPGTTLATCAPSTARRHRDTCQGKTWTKTVSFKSQITSICSMAPTSVPGRTIGQQTWHLRDYDINKVTGIWYTPCVSAIMSGWRISSYAMRNMPGVYKLTENRDKQTKSRDKQIVGRHMFWNKTQIRKRTSLLKFSVLARYSVNHLSDSWKLCRRRTSCHGNSFRITDPLCKESITNPWISLTKFVVF